MNVSRVLLSALLAVAPCAYAESVRPNTIFVIGESRVDAFPDHAVVQVVASTQGTDRTQIFARLQKTADEIIEMLQAGGVRREDIEASDLDRRDEVNDKKVRTTVLERRFRVVSRDLSATTKLIDKLLVLPNVGSLRLTFQSSNDAQIRSKLLGLAAEDARSKGSALATALGRKLGAASTISEEPLEEIQARMTGAGHLVLRERPSFVPPPEPGSAQYRVPEKLQFSSRIFVIFDLQ